MSSVRNIHTIYPSAIPAGYFDHDNIKFIQDKCNAILKRELGWSVTIDKASLVRLMDRVLEERTESIPKLNQRVIMYACADYRRHVLEVNKVLNWEEGYIESQRLFDPIGAKSNYSPIKMTTTSIYPRYKNTCTHFYFT
jgi:hypothetical protein